MPYVPDWMYDLARMIGCEVYQLNFDLVRFILEIEQNVERANQTLPPHVNEGKLRSTQVLALALETWRRLRPEEAPYTFDRTEDQFFESLAKLME